MMLLLIFLFFIIIIVLHLAEFLINRLVYFAFNCVVTCGHGFLIPFFKFLRCLFFHLANIVYEEKTLKSDNQTYVDRLLLFILNLFLTFLTVYLYINSCLFVYTFRDSVWLNILRKTIDFALFLTNTSISDGFVH
jgi:hypothetical protein